MNAIKHSGGLGVPLAEPRVALSATSPRADYRAVGFSLQSLTRNARPTFSAIRYLLILLLVAWTKVLSGQDSLAVVHVVERIGHIHADSASVYFCDLDSVPTEVMMKLMTNSHMKGDVNARSIHKYMADQGEHYEATDMVTGELPRRKFLFGQTNGNEMFFMYFHGGIGNHLHLVYVNRQDSLSISAFVTLNNWTTLRTLDYERRVNKVKESVLRAPLVGFRDMKALHSKVYDEFDLF